MDFNSILNQVLGGGQQITQQRSNGGLGGSLGGGLGNLLGGINKDTLKGFGGGMAATGLLSLLTGNKGFGRSALQAGSIAALGALAYNAWKNYQGSQPAKAGAAMQGQFIPAEQRNAAPSSAKSVAKTPKPVPGLSNKCKTRRRRNKSAPPSVTTRHSPRKSTLPRASSAATLTAKKSSICTNSPKRCTSMTRW